MPGYPQPNHITSCKYVPPKPPAAAGFAARGCREDLPPSARPQAYRPGRRGGSAGGGQRASEGTRTPDRGPQARADRDGRAAAEVRMYDDTACYILVCCCAAARCTVLFGLALCLTVLHYATSYFSMLSLCFTLYCVLCAGCCVVPEIESLTRRWGTTCFCLFR